MPFAITPALIDGILVGIGLEFFAVCAWLLRTSWGHLIGPFALYLASGASLMVALRVALAGAPETWLALALLSSLVTHLGSLAWLARSRAIAPLGATD